MSARPQRILLGLLAVVAAGAAFWLLGAEDSTPGIEQAERPLAEPAPRTELSLEGLSPITASPFDRESDREEAAAPESEPSLCLVRMPDGQPARDVELLLLRPTQGRGFPFAEEQDRRALRKLQTNAEGLATLSPLPRRSLTLEVRSGELFGVTEFRQQDPLPSGVPDGVVAVVQLEPVKHVTVTVRDGGGAPAGRVQVELREPRDNNNPFESMGPGGRDRGGRGGRGGPRGAGLRAFTDTTTGVASFEVTARESEFGDLEEIEVAALLPGRDEVTARATLLPEGTTHAALAIPPSLLLTLQLVDASGSALKEDATLLLQRARDEAATSPQRGRFAMPTMLRMEAGHIAVGGIEPGVRLTATTSSRQRLSATSAVNVPMGLSQHNANVQAGLREATVAITLLDAEGGPVPWFSFTTRLRDAAAETANTGRGGNPWDTGRMNEMLRRGGRPLVTDAEGRAEFAVDPRGGVLELHASDRGFQGMGFGGGAEPLHSIPLPAMKEGGRTDLGPQRLPDLLALATGRIVAADTTGVEDVTLRASEPATGNSASMEESLRGRSGPRAQSQNQNRSLGSVSSGKEGRFKLYGERPESGRVDLAVEGRELVSEKISVAAGAKDVVVRLVATGELVGNVIFPDTRLKLEVDVVATAKREDLVRRESRTRVRRDGTFSLRDIPVGLCSVKLIVNGEDERTLDGLDVVAKERTAPAALKDLLVGRDWALAELTVRGPAGLPVRGARVSVRNVEDSLNAMARAPNGTSTTNADGRVEFTLRLQQRHSVSVTAEDFLRWQQEVPTFPATITLERALEFTVALPLNLALPEGARMRVFLVPTDAATTDLRAVFGGGGASFDLASGMKSVTVRNAALGSYSLRAFGRGGAQGGGPGGRQGGRGGPQGGALTPIGTLELRTDGATLALDLPALQGVAQGATPPGNAPPR